MPSASSSSTLDLRLNRILLAARMTGLTLCFTCKVSFPSPEYKLLYFSLHSGFSDSDPTTLGSPTLRTPNVSEVSLPSKLSNNLVFFLFLFLSWKVPKTCIGFSFPYVQTSACSFGIGTLYLLFLHLLPCVLLLAPESIMAVISIPPTIMVTNFSVFLPFTPNARSPSLCTLLSSGSALGPWHKIQPSHNESTVVCLVVSV